MCHWAKESVVSRFGRRKTKSAKRAQAKAGLRKASKEARVSKGKSLAGIIHSILQKEDKTYRAGRSKLQQGIPAIDLSPAAKLMHQQLDRHGKQTKNFARLFAALYVVCSGRDGHEKETLCFWQYHSAFRLTRTSLIFVARFHCSSTCTLRTQRGRRVR